MAGRGDIEREGERERKSERDLHPGAAGATDDWKRTRSTAGREREGQERDEHERERGTGNGNGKRVSGEENGAWDESSATTPTLANRRTRRHFPFALIHHEAIACSPTLAPFCPSIAAGLYQVLTSCSSFRLARTGPCLLPSALSCVACHASNVISPLLFASPALWLIVLSPVETNLQSIPKQLYARMSSSRVTLPSVPASPSHTSSTHSSGLISLQGRSFTQRQPYSP